MHIASTAPLISPVAAGIRWASTIAVRRPSPVIPRATHPTRAMCVGRSAPQAVPALRSVPEVVGSVPSLEPCAWPAGSAMCLSVRAGSVVSTQRGSPVEAAPGDKSASLNSGSVSPYPNLACRMRRRVAPGVNVKPVCATPAPSVVSTPGMLRVPPLARPCADSAARRARISPPVTDWSAVTSAGSTAALVPASVKSASNTPVVSPTARTKSAVPTAVVELAERVKAPTPASGAVVSRASRSVRVPHAAPTAAAVNAGLVPRVRPVSRGSARPPRVSGAVVPGRRLAASAMQSVSPMATVVPMYARPAPICAVRGRVVWVFPQGDVVRRRPYFAA